MNDVVYIQPVFSLWIIIGGLASALCLMIWKEYQRKIKFFLWRLLAVAFLILSLLGLLVQPSWVTKIKSTGLVVLTPHYQPEVADSLLKANPLLKFVTVDGARAYNNSTEVSSSDELIHSQIVLGDGLSEFVLQEMKSNFFYYKSELPFGIIKWAIPPNFKINQKNEISGTLHSKGKATIKLIGPGGPEDSIAFTKSGIYPFKVSFTPRQAGLFLYSLTIRDGLETVSQKFPAQVPAEKKLRILLSLKYPTAEARYLKNFLIEKGHSMVTRFQISRNNYRYEYSLHQPIKVDKVSVDLMKDFDLFITDNESLESFLPHETTALEESVKQGLGLLVLHNSFSKPTNSFLSIPLKIFKNDTAHVQLGSSNYSFSTLPASIDALAIEAITQGRDRTLSGYLSKGVGKIGFQLLQETYRLLLQGKVIEYAELWSPLLEQTSRAQDLKFKIQVEQEFPLYSDEPLNVNLISTKLRPHLLADNIFLPLREDVVIDDYWHGTTWAGKVGWHKLAIEKDSTVKNYYVSAPSEWQSLRIAPQQNANKLASQAKNNDLTQKEIRTERNPISSLLLFLIFLLSLGFLWLAPKI